MEHVSLARLGFRLTLLVPHLQTLILQHPTSLTHDSSLDHGYNKVRITDSENISP